MKRWMLLRTCRERTTCGLPVRQPTRNVVDARNMYVGNSIAIASGFLYEKIESTIHKWKARLYLERNQARPCRLAIMQASALHPRRLPPARQRRKRPGDRWPSQPARPRPRLAPSWAARPCEAAPGARLGPSAPGRGGASVAKGTIAGSGRPVLAAAAAAREREREREREAERERGGGVRAVLRAAIAGANRKAAEPPRGAAALGRPHANIFKACRKCAAHLRRVRSSCAYWVAHINSLVGQAGRQTNKQTNK